MFCHYFNLIRSLFREHNKKATRSPLWEGVERDFRSSNATCAACGSTEHLQVHHVKPFHMHPELELDSHNLIPLCMGPNECHLKIGHGDNFRDANPNVREDAAAALADPSKLAEVALKAKTARVTLE